MSPAKTMAEPSAAPAAAAPAAPSVSFTLQSSGIYQRGVQTYRVTITYLARVWTPPAMLEGVDSASFVLVLSTALCVMESYHAARYVLRQLHRFKTETALRHITRLKDGLSALQSGSAKKSEESDAAALTKKSKETLDDSDREAEDKNTNGEGEGEDAALPLAHTAPPSFCQRLVRRARAIFPSPASPADTHSDASDNEETLNDPLHAALREESEFDLMSRDVSVPFEMSNLPTQRGVSQMSGAMTDRPPSMVLHDEGDEDDEEEEQTWEATPEMLMHYWKQLERTILCAPRRNPKRFFRALPDEMTDYEPDTHAVNAWFDDITHHLHDGTSAWSWFSAGAAWTAGGDVDESAAPPAPPITKVAGLGGGGDGLPCPAWQRRITFTVPPNGCFAYHTKPPVEDFYPDTEEDTEEEDEENLVGEEGGNEQAKLLAEVAADASGQKGQAPTSLTVDTGATAGPSNAASESHPLAADTIPPAVAAAAAAPATSNSFDSTFAVLPPAHRPRKHTLHWEALLLVWFNVAEVPMSSREIRALLLKASPPPFMSPAMVRDDGPTDFDLASTNLSILWFWSTLQRVFETLVINEDVEKCEADFEELQSYAMPLFIKCIARWPVPSQMEETSEVAFNRGLVGFICVVQSTWIMLNAVLHKLLSLRRRLYYRNTWSLLRYMYSSSKAKIMSAALITVMMTISSRVSAAGRVVRERIANYVENSADGATDSGGAGAGPQMNLRLMLGLCGFELTRMAVQYVISNTTSEFIVLTASQRREIVKMQLYEALSHTQMTFYEQHTYEEVEEIIYYVSDMEGIDVQLHQYLFNAINVFMELKDALQPFTYRSMVVAAGVAMAPYALRRIATLVEQRYLLAQREGYLPSGAYAVEDDYQGEDDDSNVLREGAMLRGDEIIAAIPQLRPYGADVRLVRWWNRHQQRRQHIKMSHHQRTTTTTHTAASGGAKGGGGGHGRSTSSKAGGRDGSPSSPLRSARVPLSAGGRSAGGHNNNNNKNANANSSKKAVVPRVSWGEYIQSFFGSWITDEDVGLVRSALIALAQLPHGKLLPGTGKAILDLSEWLLPMAASAYGIAWCGQSNLDPFQLVQGMQAIEAAVDSMSEAVDTAEMVGYNAYKASMLERLLQPTQWEVISREEEPYMANFTISATGVGEANDVRQRCLEHAQLMSKSLAVRPPAGPQLGASPARAAGFYRRHVVRHIEIQNIRLRHAPVEQQPTRRRRRSASTSPGLQPRKSATTAAAAGSRTATPRSTSLPSGATAGFESAIAQATNSADGVATEDENEEENESFDAVIGDGAPLFSADIVLWSPPQQRGRFVCITAPNGGGKTALVNLLLALYINCGGPLPSSAASSPHAGRLGSGSVTFCFAARTRHRRQRRGGLTSRNANASVTNLSRGARPANTGRSIPAFSSRSNTAIATDRYGGDGHGDITARGGETRVDLRMIPADVLRRHIFSYVPEMPTIFSGATVAQNISLAGYVSVAADALMRRVAQCAELAQCDFIQRLPLGMLTRISDTTASSWNTAGQYSTGAGNSSVTRLSADQAKRLMLARAYFHGGEVLLMDEPTKEIEDTSTAQKMCEGWRKLLEKGYCSGVICLTMDETLLSMADEVITLP